MNSWYPIGYLFVVFTMLVHADHQKIEKYFILVENMKNFILMVEQHVDQYQYLDLYRHYDHAITGTRDISEFICSCITTSSVASKTGAMIKGNAYLQLALVTYTLLQDCMRIWHDHKMVSNQRKQMLYQDMIVKYPFLWLIEQQICIMKLLIDMCCTGFLPERIFAKIKLASIIIPGPYQRVTKKWSKKLYKSVFDNDGNLIDARVFEGKHPYQHFADAVTSDWRFLLMNVAKMPTSLVLFHKSKYADKIDNDVNQILLAMIDAGMHNDLALVIKLSENQKHFLVQELSSFYSFRIGA